jgi:competence protein ComEA
MVILPRIGSALAHRIVANRDSAGPFGSLEGLKRVRGVGVGTLKLLAPLVTFSGQTRR